MPTGTPARSHARLAWPDLAEGLCQDLRELAQHLVFASTGLWFLYALAAYFVVAKVLLRIPSAWVIGGAATLTAVTTYLPLDGANRVSVVAHLVYFLVGSRGAKLVGRLVARQRSTWLLALALG